MKTKTFFWGHVIPARPFKLETVDDEKPAPTAEQIMEIARRVVSTGGSFEFNISTWPSLITFTDQIGESAMVSTTRLGLSIQGTIDKENTKKLEDIKQIAFREHKVIFSYDFL